MVGTLIKNARVEQLQEPLLEVSFPVMPGSKISSLHSYPLYSAIKTKMSWVRDCPFTSICSIAGVKDEKGSIETQDFSRLQIRTPLSKASSFYGLAGKRLSIGQGEIVLQIPTIAPLQPKSTLKARVVIIHLKPRQNRPSPESFLAVAKRHLTELGIKGKISLLSCRGVVDNKVIIVKGSHIPGYGVQVSDLSPEDSIKLMTCGLGGKRKMGAGYFN